MSFNSATNNPRSARNDEHPAQDGNTTPYYRHDQKRNLAQDTTNVARKENVGIPELHDFIDDISRVDSGQDLFVKVASGIAEYMSCTYDHAGEFRLGMMSKQELPDLTPPMPPTGENPSITIVEIYKLDLKDYQNNISWRQENMGKVFSLVLNQCTTAVCDKLEASAEWNGLNKGNDVMGLL